MRKSKGGSLLKYIPKHHYPRLVLIKFQKVTTAID